MGASHLPPRRSGAGLKNLTIFLILTDSRSLDKSKSVTILEFTFWITNSGQMGNSLAIIPEKPEKRNPARYADLTLLLLERSIPNTTTELDTGRQSLW
jgi:hypothetical protein